MENKLRVALIAHDRKKEELIKFVKENERLFAGFDLFATRMTGMQILKKTSLKIQCFDSGSRGGDQEIGVMIAKGELDAVFFFRDLLTAKAFEPDVNTLPRLCDIYNIPVATNPESAKGILVYLQSGLSGDKPSRKIKLRDSKVQVYQNADVNIDYLEPQQSDRQKDGENSMMPNRQNADVNIDHLEPKQKDRQKDGENSIVQTSQNADVNVDYLEQTPLLSVGLDDSLRKDVLTYIYENQKASALLLQLKFRMTSNRAAGLIKELEAQGLIGPMEGNKPREVLMTEEQYHELTS